MSNLRQNLLEPIHNFHFFFKRAVVICLPDFHAALDYLRDALGPHKVNFLGIAPVFEFILNIVLSLVPYLVSIIQEGVFEVEPQNTVIGL